MARTKRRNWIEQNSHGLVFDELNKGQAVMHYSKHSVTASLTYVTTLTYVSSND